MELTHKIFLCLVVLLAVNEVYQVDGKLSVHIIPHSHCDPGWLQTYREYYQSQVRKILNNVLQHLRDNQNKTFIWAEISYFKLWWEELSLSDRKDFMRILKNGQLEFVGGGWVQNDEAAVNWDLVVDQVTEGHDYVLRHFGVKPRVAWQVDPFGHSSFTPSLFAQLGYEAMVINRIHSNLKGNYKQSKSMEFVWRPSNSLGEKTDMITHVLHTHYAAPVGFDWEEMGQSPRIDNNNINYRAENLVSVFRERSNAYRTSTLLVAWGDDFKFQDANLQYEQMDKLIAHINSHFTDVHVQYSTLSRYFSEMMDDARKNSINLPIYHGDFFPYADNEYSYWTGYYSTRPLLKGAVRETKSILDAAEMIYSLARMRSAESDVSYILPSWESSFQQIQEGRWDLALTAHHDGVTGTSRERVVTDYMGGLFKAQETARSTIATSVSILLAKDLVPKFEFGSVLKLAEAPTHVVTFMNRLGWNRKQIVLIPVDSKLVHVKDDTGKPIKSQILPYWARDNNDFKIEPELNRFDLAFEVDVTPMGLRSYFICVGSSDQTLPSQYTIYDSTMQKNANYKPIGSEIPFIENPHIALTYDKETGGLAQQIDKSTNITRRLEVDYLFYATRNSGAYIFRSEGGQASSCGWKKRVYTVQGPLVSFAMSFSRCGTHMSRIYTYETDEDLSKVVENVHFLNSLDVNQELVVRYYTNMHANGEFFTDNGLELRHRTYDTTKLVERNYYPGYHSALLRTSINQLSLLSRQGFGVTTGFVANSSSYLELMVHRRMGQDDGRGLSEAVNDASTPRLYHWALYDSIENSEQNRQRYSMMLENPLRWVSAQTKMKPSEWIETFNTKFEPMNELPKNVHLMSFKSRTGLSDEMIMRFVHIFETDTPLGKPAKFDIASLWRSHQINGIKQVSASLHFIPFSKRPEIPVNINDKVPNLEGAKSISNNKVNQNSEEEGVFLSADALKHAKAGRQLQSVDDLGFELSPIMIGTFIMDLESDITTSLSPHTDFWKARPTKQTQATTLPAQKTTVKQTQKPTQTTTPKATQSSNNNNNNNNNEDDEDEDEDDEDEDDNGASSEAISELTKLIVGLQEQLDVQSQLWNSELKEERKRREKDEREIAALKEKLRQLQQGKIAGRNPFEQQPVEPEESSSSNTWSSEFKLLMGVSSFGVVLILIVFLKLFGSKARNLASAFGSNAKLSLGTNRSGAKVA